MGELTNSKRKIFTSLSSAKGRREHSLFLAQGTKCVLDIVDNFEIETILATFEWIGEHPDTADIHDVTTVKRADLERISTLTTAPDVIAVCRIPEQCVPHNLRGTLTLALDGVQDPGNMGTIIRVADWMGVNQIFASHDTVDVWNPKVVQATMGAISRVSIHYVHLPDFLVKYHNEMPVYGTFLDGKDIYSTQLSKEGIVVMGNEGNGISDAVADKISQRIFIPSFPADRPTSESLNVAVATAITLSEFRRRML